MAAILAGGCGQSQQTKATGSSYHVTTAGSAAGNGSTKQPWDLATALAHPANLRPNDTIWIHGGTYHGAFLSALAGGENNLIVVRAVAGERATIDGSLEVRGQYTVYWGFEIMNSTSRGTPADSTRPAGLVVHGRGTKLVNLVVHDAGSGVGFWATAVDAELYGTIIYNNGWQGATRGYGSGVSTQNNEGTKRIADNVVFQQFENGIVAFGSENASLTGFALDGNVAFDNGLPSESRAGVDIFIGGGSPAARIALRNNYTHRSDGLLTARFGYEPTVVNKDLVLADNYFVGQTGIAQWQSATVTGNTFTGAANVLEVTTPDGSVLKGYDWNNNKYYPDPRRKALNSSSPIVAVAKDSGVGYDFAAWTKATGHDHGGESGARPRGVHIFVRPNVYEPGRATIVVYNWDHAPQADIDLSKVLQNGDGYEVHDVQDLYGKPLFSGTYTGAPRFKLPFLSATPVALPLKGAPRAEAVGAAALPAADPEFAVFVVTRTQAASH